jgi:hypothetical protein
MIAGLAATLPRTLTSGLRAQGVPQNVAAHVAHLPPVSTLFSALLGYNPIGNLLGPSGALARLPRRNAAVLTGKQFFPHLISGPFHHGLIIVFSAAIVMSLTGAFISLLRGRRFYYDEEPAQPSSAQPGTPVTAGLASPSQNGSHGAGAPAADASQRAPDGLTPDGLTPDGLTLRWRAAERVRRPGPPPAPGPDQARGGGRPHAHARLDWARASIRVPVPRLRRHLRADPPDERVVRTVHLPPGP